MARFWTNAAGKILVDATGKPLDCPVCPCDEEGCEVCSESTPSQLRVIIDGAANSSCSNCTDINDTFILTQLSPTSCTWRYNFPEGLAECGTVVDVGHIIAFLYHDEISGNVMLGVTANFAEHHTSGWEPVYYFVEDLGYQPSFDCAALGVPTPQDVTISWLSQGYAYCYQLPTAATCTVEAL